MVLTSANGNRPGVFYISGNRKTPVRGSPLTVATAHEWRQREMAPSAARLHHFLGVSARRHRLAARQMSFTRRTYFENFETA
jgi:hypothetical protein